jgi:hypothetical protein
VAATLLRKTSLVSPLAGIAAATYGGEAPTKTHRNDRKCERAVGRRPMSVAQKDECDSIQLYKSTRKSRRPLNSGVHNSGIQLEQRTQLVNSSGGTNPAA